VLSWRRWKLWVKRKMYLNWWHIESRDLTHHHRVHVLSRDMPTLSLSKQSNFYSHMCKKRLFGLMTGPSSLAGERTSMHCYLRHYLQRVQGHWHVPLSENPLQLSAMKHDIQSHQSNISTSPEPSDHTTNGNTPDCTVTDHHVCHAGIIDGKE
jgi:hypothetical protein